MERGRAGESERTKRQERAHRILDAAAELIQRWGYKKTAVDDIARLAGVAKGTIYLHWKTREDLFATLLLRESVKSVVAMHELVDADPLGIYMSHVVKHVMYVVMTRPLTKALFLQDIEVLGGLLQSAQEDLSIISQRKLVANRQLCVLYRQRGLLRTDQGLDEQLKIISALIIGFLMSNQYLPPELHSSPEEIVDLMASAIHDALEPAEPVAPAILQELRTAWERVYTQMVQLYQERLQREME
jgi:AcrR family transcriptional regulator